MKNKFPDPHKKRTEEVAHVKCERCGFGVHHDVNVSHTRKRCWICSTVSEVKPEEIPYIKPKKK